jgi:hypothetical protein
MIGFEICRNIAKANPHPVAKQDGRVLEDFFGRDGLEDKPRD